MNIDIIVETPGGSPQKYNYDPQLRLFKLKKILPAGMVFPYDFGFIPGTKGEDGDPLDVIVVAEFFSFPGCVMECRLIGGIKARQTERDGRTDRNDRFLAVPVQSGIFEKIKLISDLPVNRVRELENFFINYNKLAGKHFEVLGRLNPKQAFQQIKQAGY